MIRWLTFPGMGQLSRAMADAEGGDVSDVEVHRFPDGESLVTVPQACEGSDIAIVATLRDPDSLALPLRFAAATARQLGARRVGLVAPYLSYMRQDRRFAPGQSVSAPLFARFIEEAFDWVVTADPHLHRIGALDEIFAIPTVRVETAPLIADWIQNNVPDAVLLGPDSESRQWVGEVARLAVRPFEVLEKVRGGDRDVDISAPQNATLRSGTPVILDDIASSGRTMIKSIERLKAAGTVAPVCIVIHAIFAGSAYDDILFSGAARIISTDSIPHPSNTIHLAPSLARGVIDLTKEQGSLR